MSLDVKLLCVLQDFLFHMINLWSSMKVSHLHMYAQLLRSSEWQLCFTRRYGSTVKVTVCACFCMKHKMIYVCITGHYAVSQGPYPLDERRAVNIMFLRVIFKEKTLQSECFLADLVQSNHYYCTLSFFFNYFGLLAYQIYRPRKYHVNVIQQSFPTPTASYLEFWRNSRVQYFTQSASYL